MKNPQQQLELILSPFGIRTITTGDSRVTKFLKKLYGSSDDDVIFEKFCEKLKKIKDAKILILGVPNDNGAGFERGSKMGPLEIREKLLPMLKKLEGVVDIGDVRDHPLLVDDTLYQEWVIDAVRENRWGEFGNTSRELQLPVSPLSILERALECIYTINPAAKVLMLGGDHSKSLIPINVLTKPGLNKEKDLGILQIDAHTDLLLTRNGLPFSFATWAWHANEKIGRNKHLIQVGLRVSKKSKEYWENNLDLIQYWAEEVNNNEEEIIEKIITDFHNSSIKRLYISNDIDGISPEYAHATGTPEPNGLTPSFVITLFEKLTKHFNVIGSDIMEVAPPLHNNISGEPDKTLTLAANFALKQIESMIASSTKSTIY